MGKRIIAQRRGSGSPLYKYPSFWGKGEAKYLPLQDSVTEGIVVDIIRDRMHSAPLAIIKFGNKKVLHIAAKGIAVGDKIYYNKEAKDGNILMLKDIPEGSNIFNIEGMPGDGGKFVRAAGTYAKLVAKYSDYAVVLLPSGKEKRFNLKCRATIGIVAGAGMKDKPFVKAGNKYYYAKVRHKNWPKVSGSAMNAVDHPFGNKRTQRKSKARPVSRNAPPGRKVGYIAAKRTGRKKKG